jgi:thioredoxin 1
MMQLKETMKVVLIVAAFAGMIYLMNRPDGPPGGKVGVVNDSTFEGEVIKSAVPVAVEFRSRYCSACRMFRGKFESLSEKLDGRMKFYELDINDSAETAGTYGVEALPTTHFFFNGRIVGTLKGNVSRDALEKTADGVLKGGGKGASSGGWDAPAGGCLIASSGNLPCAN